MIKGRKRPIVTDTMGLLLAVVVHAANVHDSKGASDVIALLKDRFERLVKIFADGGYRVELIEKTRTTFGWILEIVLRSDRSSKFTVIPKRWVGERTFTWFESYRRLSKDFEYLTNTSEVMIQIAMIRLMLNRFKIKFKQSLKRVIFAFNWICVKLPNEIEISFHISYTNVVLLLL